MKKTLDIRKKFVKKKILMSKESLIKAINREDVTVFLEEESHWDNGESELVYRMHVKNNFA